MPTDHRAELASIKRFDQLIAYLRDEMGWPIARDSFEDVDDLFYDFTADELGIDPKTAAKIESIKRLRPLSLRQPWGIFFVKFEPRKLPVVALRRILSQVALKKRASANSAERTAWAADDLLFISNYGDGDERQISFAHFSQSETRHDLPTLKVLGWNNLDTALHLDAVARELTQHLAWPDDDSDVEAWRKSWRGAFTLRHLETVTTSKELSIRLAALARDIRDRIRTVLAIETATGPLTKLMKAFQASLVHDLDAEGFADMYAQTIAYGLLSARIADPHKKTADDFAGHMRTNPFLRELMETFLKVGGRRGKAGGPGIDFDELGVSDVVELLDDTNMEAVVRDFGDRNPQEDPVIHFYELFLKEYDAKKRMQRGVFYTPRPVVSYIVRSAHELLQTDFGLADGLADTATWGEMAERHASLTIPEGVKPGDRFVTILDPATGTGTFLVEAIEIIHRTLVDKWVREGRDRGEILNHWNQYVPEHLLPRLYGYELLMAPYAIAHLKVGLKLHETGYRFGSDERARIYLTNALEPAHDFSGQFEFAIPALAHEAQAVNGVKRHQRFTVVIGNPPYSGLSSNMSLDAQRLVDAYKVVDGQALDERKIWLQDDYVKFVRLAQVTLEKAGIGLLGFITNHGYLTNPTFRGMRRSLMHTFPRLRLLDLHGNATRQEKPPASLEDRNVFEIKQGVAICLATQADLAPAVHHADLWGTREAKYGWLLSHTSMDTAFASVVPDPPHYFFKPQDTVSRAQYDCGFPVNELMPVNSAGAITARDHFVVDFDREALLARIADLASLNSTDSEIRSRYFSGLGSTKYPEGDTRGWKLPEARRAIRADGAWRSRVRRYLYRPFDYRYVYWTPSMVDWPRPELERQLGAPNQLALCITRFNRQKSTGYFFVTRVMADFHCLDTAGDSTSLFPLRLAASEDLGLDDRLRGYNLTHGFGQRLSTAFGAAEVVDGLPDGLDPESVVGFVYAIFHSPGFRSRYAEFLKIDFPRVPIPRSPSLLTDLAFLGQQLIALHLLESPQLDALVTTYSGPTNPEVGRVVWSEHVVWLDAAATKKGQPATPGSIGFVGVPESVWSFHVGGYQVCEKWLKDRKGRTLSAEDIAHYQKIVVAISETIRLMGKIDEVIDQHGGWPGAFAVVTNDEPASLLD